MKKISNLAWIDLEMTGLNFEKDVILEIASIVTDKNLNIIEQGPSLVINQPEEKLNLMDEWVRNTHTKSGLVTEVKKSKTSLEEAQKLTKEFFDKYCFIGVTPLCGNSVWQDRRFLLRYMPELDNFFNYRIVDVSSIKEVLKRWDADNPLLDFKKSENHRAMQDTQESILELAHYRKNFFV